MSVDMFMLFTFQIWLNYKLLIAEEICLTFYVYIPIMVGSQTDYIQTMNIHQVEFTFQ